MILVDKDVLNIRFIQFLIVLEKHCNINTIIWINLNISVGLLYWISCGTLFRIQKYLYHSPYSILCALICRQTYYIHYLSKFSHYKRHLSCCVKSVFTRGVGFRQLVNKLRNWWVQDGSWNLIVDIHPSYKKMDYYLLIENIWHL